MKKLLVLIGILCLSFLAIAATPGPQAPLPTTMEVDCTSLQNKLIQYLSDQADDQMKKDPDVVGIITTIVDKKCLSTSKMLVKFRAELIVKAPPVPPSDKSVLICGAVTVAARVADTKDGLDIEPLSMAVEEAKPCDGVNEKGTK